jgi:hypothetical protein
MIEKFDIRISSQDAAPALQPTARAVFTRLTSSELDGTRARLHEIAVSCERLGYPHAAAACRRFAGIDAAVGCIARLEEDMPESGLKTGQSQLPETIQNWLRELREQTREGDR